MTPQSFAKQMAIIIEIFGPHEFSKQRLDMIYDIVNELPDKNFEFIVKQFCKNLSVRKPPLPVDFENAVMDRRKRNNTYAAAKTFEVLEERGPEKLREIFEKMGIDNVIDGVARFKDKS